MDSDIRQALIHQQNAIARVIKYVQENVPSEDQTRLTKAAEHLYEAGHYIDKLKGL